MHSCAGGNKHKRIVLASRRERLNLSEYLLREISRKLAMGT
jgi:hypothetical protein